MSWWRVVVDVVGDKRTDKFSLSLIWLRLTKTTFTGEEIYQVKFSEVEASMARSSFSAKLTDFV